MWILAGGQSETIDHLNHQRQSGRVSDLKISQAEATDSANARSRALVRSDSSHRGFYFLRGLPTRPLFLARPNISAQRAYRRTGIFLFLLSFLFSSVLELHFLPLTLPSVLLGVPSGRALVGVLPSLGDSVEFRFLPISFVFRLSRVSAFFCRVHLLSPLYFLVLWWSFSYVGFVFDS